MSEDGGMLSADVCCLSEASSNGGCMISGGAVCSGSSRGADPCSGQWHWSLSCPGKWRFQAGQWSSIWCL